MGRRKLTPEREKVKGVWEEIADRAEAEAVMQEGLAAGMLKFRLSGQKLQGSFALIRTRGMGRPKSWLLIKHADGYTQAGYDANAYDSSAVSGRSLAQIAAVPQEEVNLSPLLYCPALGEAGPPPLPYLCDTLDPVNGMSFLAGRAGEPASEETLDLPGG